MSTAKHTPGPWEAAGLTIFESSGQHRDICEMFSCHEHTVEISEQEAEANASLIAATPAMLEALERADQLLTQCLAILNNKKIEDHIPSGVKEDVAHFVLNCVGTGAIRLAKGETL